VAGTSAALFDAEDPRSIASTVERLLSDPAERARLAEGGPAQAALFSWEETARGTLACYERAVAQAG
jgi:glycosyltransferase involved in cell wall biosynthesis